MYKPQGKLYKVQGIILSRKNVGEADRIVTVFTKEHGKIRVIAKGVRKASSRRAPYLEVFSENFMVIHKGVAMDSITEITSKKSSSDLREDLSAMSLAYFYCELVNLLLPEKQEHKDVYEMLSGSLIKLRTQDNNTRHKSSRLFARELLHILGYLEADRSLSGTALEDFIENITERKLRTPKLVRQIAHVV